MRPTTILDYYITNMPNIQNILNYKLIKENKQRLYNTPEVQTEFQPLHPDKNWNVAQFPHRYNLQYIGNLRTYV